MQDRRDDLPVDVLIARTPESAGMPVRVPY